MNDEGDYDRHWQEDKKELTSIVNKHMATSGEAGSWERRSDVKQRSR